ncbi:MAG TPA: hypothetical protein VFB70_04365 [Pyrinomonadaceae bacterium]|nr:hypothetical protein [Pyrinomonadaceae bacterium]
MRTEKNSAISRAVFHSFQGTGVEASFFARAQTLPFTTASEFAKRLFYATAINGHFESYNYGT